MLRHARRPLSGTASPKRHCSLPFTAAFATVSKVLSMTLFVDIYLINVVEHVAAFIPAALQPTILAPVQARESSTNQTHAVQIDANLSIHRHEASLAFHVDYPLISPPGGNRRSDPHGKLRLESRVLPLLVKMSQTYAYS